MVVTATFSDGTSKAVTGYTYAPNGALELTDDTITVTYGGKSASVSIEVLNNDTSVTSIVVDGENAVKGEDDNWSVTLPAATTSIDAEDIVITLNDENASYVLVPDSYAEVTAGDEKTSVLTVTAEDESTSNYNLVITIATE